MGYPPLNGFGIPMVPGENAQIRSLGKYVHFGAFEFNEGMERAENTWSLNGEPIEIEFKLVGDPKELPPKEPDPGTNTYTYITYVGGVTYWGDDYLLNQPDFRRYNTPLKRISVPYPGETYKIKNHNTTPYNVRLLLTDRDDNTNGNQVGPFSALPQAGPLRRNNTTEEVVNSKYIYVGTDGTGREEDTWVTGW